MKSPKVINQVSNHYNLNSENTSDEISVWLSSTMFDFLFTQLVTDTGEIFSTDELDIMNLSLDRMKLNFEAIS